MSQIKPQLSQVFFFFFLPTFTCLSTLVTSYLKYLLCTLSIRFIQGPEAAAAKSLQSCPTLCDPMDGRPPGTPSLGFSRQEHWSGLPFPSPMHESEKWTWSHSVVSTLVTPWTAAYQAPPSMGFSRQKYWSGVPLPSPYKILGRWYLKLRFQVQKGKKKLR